MKIIQFSDWHLADAYISEDFRKGIQVILKKEPPDIVLLTGDIWDCCEDEDFVKDVYSKIAECFLENTVLCTLGNHEFYGKTVNQTLLLYKEFYNPEKYDVHYLDIVGHYDIGKFRFLGNALMYDGSCRTVPEQVLGEFYLNGWPDSRILDFNYKSVCEYFKEQIRKNYSKTETNVLCTHCIPHEQLNMHLPNREKPHLFDAYSGVSCLLDEMHFDYSFSGHTHMPLGKKQNSSITINGCECYNPGSDFLFFRYVATEIY